MNIELINSLDKEERELLGLDMIETGLFLSLEEMSKKCIRESEIKKMTEQERQTNKKSIIGDDADVAVVLSYGSKVVSWASEGYKIYISNDSSTNFIVHQFTQFTKPNGEKELKRVKWDIDAYKDTTVEGYAVNLFQDDLLPFYLDKKYLNNDDTESITEEDFIMENNKGFDESVFTSDGFDEGGFEAFEESFGADTANLNEFDNMGGQTADEAGVTEDFAASSEGAAYLQKSVKVLAFMASKESMSTIATKKIVKKRIFMGKEIPLLSEEGKANEMAVKYVSYLEAKAKDPKAPAVEAPKVEGKDGKMKTYTLKSTEKVYEEKLIRKQSTPKIGSVVVKTTAGGDKAIQTLYINSDDLVNGSIDYNAIDAANQNATSLKMLSLADMKRFLTLTDGIIYEEKTAAVMNPGIIFLKETKSGNTLGYLPGEGSDKKNILCKNNYLPEKVVKSAPLSVRATDEELKALAVSGEIYASIIGEEKLKNLSEETKKYASFDAATGKWSFPALSNRDELSDFANAISAGTWYDKDAKDVEPRLTLVYLKESKDGTKINKKRDSWVTVPAKWSKKGEESILHENHPLHDNYLAVRDLAKGFFEYNNLKDFKSTKGTGSDKGTASKREEDAKKARKSKLDAAKKAAMAFRFNSSVAKNELQSQDEAVDITTKAKMTTKTLQEASTRLNKAFKMK